MHLRVFLASLNNRTSQMSNSAWMFWRRTTFYSWWPPYAQEKSLLFQILLFLTINCYSRFCASRMHSILREWRLREISIDQTVDAVPSADKVKASSWAMAREVVMILKDWNILATISDELWGAMLLFNFEKCEEHEIIWWTRSMDELIVMCYYFLEICHVHNTPMLHTCAMLWHLLCCLDCSDQSKCVDQSQHIFFISEASCPWWIAGWTTSFFCSSEVSSRKNEPTVRTVENPFFELRFLRSLRCQSNASKMSG